MLLRSKEVCRWERTSRRVVGVRKLEKRVERFLKTGNLKESSQTRFDAHRYMAFYKYAKIKDPEKASEDMRRRLEVLGGLGRIYISKEGVNAQMSVPAPCFDAWLYILGKYCEKWKIGSPTMSIGGIASMETEEDRPFSKLTIKVRNRIVQDALPSHIDLSLDMSSTDDFSIHPSIWHQKMALLNGVSNEEMKLSSIPSQISISSQDGVLKCSKDHQESSIPMDDLSNQSNNRENQLNEMENQNGFIGGHSSLPSLSSLSSSSSSSLQSKSSLQSNSKPLLIDCRNYYESQIGMFEGAVRLPVDRFSESFDAIDKLLEYEPDDREVLLYCTGGIRCEKVGAYLKQVKGRKNIGTLKGGINRYAKFIDEMNQNELNELKEEEEGRGMNRYQEEGPSMPVSKSSSSEETSPLSISKSSSSISKPHHPSTISSFFKGINYQFDKRNKFGLDKERVTDDVLSKCDGCGKSCDHMRNCSNPICNILLVLCDSCHSKLNGACSPSCHSISIMPPEQRLSYERDHQHQLARQLYSRSFHEKQQQSQQDQVFNSEESSSSESPSSQHSSSKSKKSTKKSPNSIEIKTSSPSSSQSQSPLPSLPFVRSKAYLSDIIQEPSAIEYRKKILLQFQDHSLVSSNQNTQ